MNGAFRSERAYIFIYRMNTLYRYERYRDVIGVLSTTSPLIIWYVIDPATHFLSSETEFGNNKSHI